MGADLEDLCVHGMKRSQLRKLWRALLAHREERGVPAQRRSSPPSSRNPQHVEADCGPLVSFFETLPRDMLTAEEVELRHSLFDLLRQAVRMPAEQARQDPAVHAACAAFLPPEITL